eukprot:UN06690
MIFLFNCFFNYTWIIFLSSLYNFVQVVVVVVGGGGGEDDNSDGYDFNIQSIVVCDVTY